MRATLLLDVLNPVVIQQMQMIVTTAIPMSGVQQLGIPMKTETVLTVLDIQAVKHLRPIPVRLKTTVMTGMLRFNRRGPIIKTSR